MSRSPREPGATDTAGSVLRRTLTLGTLVTLAIAVIAAVVGLIIAGPSGLISGLVGAAFAILFLGITALGLLIAGRSFDRPDGTNVAFAVLMGGWIVKFVVFLAAMLLIKNADWVQPVVLVLTIVATVLASLVVDVVVVSRARIPIGS